ncbi:SRPBCC family protein [Motilibacter aurantiacus]|uniref:SRPBCC family protein n=1 Tax=Motilibacter aurantiacus TaxID=2714955 RepID=UPI0014081809|nr:SRPBCC family protein [Motilibacter aurantiacus]NHC46156.1 SRPBCC family protein [Motilibacter aurantiacus]
MTTATTPLGRVLRDRDGVRLQFVRTFDAPVEDVWSALTEPDRMERWIGTWTGDPASGNVLFAMTSEGDVQPEPVRIVRCEPPHVLQLEMATGDGPWPVTATLREQSGRTELTFVHELAEPYDASAIGPGWQYYLDRLDATVRGAEPAADFEPYYPALKDAYPVPEAATP